MDMLRQFDLFAINTNFQAKHKSSNATFIKTTAVESYERYESYEDLGFLTGKQVITRYHSNWIKSTVKALDNSSTSNDEVKKWTVVFEDDYTMRCSERWIIEHLVLKSKTKRKRIQKQIDYIFVSNRWRSSVMDAKVRWGPSIHRNTYIRQRRSCSCDDV